MTWYWHLLDWVPYRSPVAMFVLGLGVGGLIVQLANVLISWWAHHSRALDREDAARRTFNVVRQVVDAEVFAVVSWYDHGVVVRFPELPGVGSRLALELGRVRWALQVVNLEWEVVDAVARVTVHCEVLDKKLPSVIVEGG